MPGGMAEGVCVIGCIQQPYLRLSRHMASNRSATVAPPSSVFALTLPPNILFASSNTIWMWAGSVRPRRMRCITTSV